MIQKLVSIFSVSAIALVLLSCAAQVFAWTVTLHASASCVNNQIVVSTSLTSGEPANIIIHVHAHDSFGNQANFDVAGGQTGTANFTLQQTSISGDTITMNLTWNKDETTDQRTITVGEASCPQPSPTPTPTITMTPTPTPTGIPTPTPTVTPTPTETPTPTPVITIPTPTPGGCTTDCNNTTVTVNQTQSQNQQQQQQQAVLAASVAPAASPSQLPSTGAEDLPVLGTLISMGAAGWKMRKWM